VTATACDIIPSRVAQQRFPTDVLFSGSIKLGAYYLLMSDKKYMVSTFNHAIRDVWLLSG
jgi:hypothetical protein